MGCLITGPLQRRQVAPGLSQLSCAERQPDHRPHVVKLQRDSNTFYLAPVDTLADGERVMSLQIEQVIVVSKMRSVPERNGQVRLDFMITLPKQLLGDSRSVVITPVRHKPDGRMELENLVIRGGRFLLCNVYEHEEIGIRRCPQVQDTIITPGWNEMKQ